jgi:hypothetical protein
MGGERLKPEDFGIEETRFNIAAALSNLLHPHREKEELTLKQQALMEIMNDPNSSPDQIRRAARLLNHPY